MQRLIVRYTCLSDRVHWPMSTFLVFLVKSVSIKTISNYRSTIFGVLNDCKVDMYFSFGLYDLALIFLDHVKFMGKLM